ncbi:TDT family transporter [Kribbella shirazensis]|uniref:Tellurite resistance protein n=1 Tax=Kribbella shirazensis TaxID=1105143 RepID=A0A7X6A4U7_9ACTN|nr:TDT family transporter [Kribbella shirazensis]NIK61385.1 tellurite resistance protein [Kribbella shirazensis]
MVALLPIESEVTMKSTSADPPPMAATVGGEARLSGSGLPIALFSIPLGLAGLGGVWEAAVRHLNVSSAPADLAYAASAVIWAIFTGMYVVGAIRRDSGGFKVDLRHPLFGPLTAYVPVIAILLIAHYAPSLGEAARWLTYVAVAALAINAAALVAHWLSAPLEQDAMHPGYFLPVVAGPFIASIGLAAVGGRSAAIAVFGVGTYFWLLLGAVITSRLFFGTPLPQPFKPVLSILLSPPGTASLAWFMITEGEVDHLQGAIGGVTLFTLLVQLFFLPDYLRLPFSSQHWVFTFPLAVLGNVGVRWSAGLRFDGWEAIAWVVLALSTASILAILGGTLRDFLRGLVSRRSGGVGRERR